MGYVSQPTRNLMLYLFIAILASIDIESRGLLPFGIFLRTERISVFMGNGLTAANAFAKGLI